MENPHHDDHRLSQYYFHQQELSLIDVHCVGDDRLSFFYVSSSLTLTQNYSKYLPCDTIALLYADEHRRSSADNLSNILGVWNLMKSISFMVDIDFPNNSFKIRVNFFVRNYIMIVRQLFPLRL